MFFGQCSFKNALAKKLEHKDTFFGMNIKSPSKLYTENISNSNCTIALYGEIYNEDEVIKKVRSQGYKATSLLQSIIYGYLKNTQDIFKELGGAFAIAIWNKLENKLILARDHLGIMPLFYCLKDDNIFFGNNIGDILDIGASYGIKAAVGINELCEVFALGPARTPSSTPFKGIKELKAAELGVFTINGFKKEEYWKLSAKPNIDNEQEIIYNVRQMIISSVEQKAKNGSVSLLSGGIDSSIITAILQNTLKTKHNTNLHTYSFDYVDNDKFFMSNSFQPERDRPWVEKTLSHLNTNHTFLQLNTSEIIKYLKDAVLAKQMPCMADIDSSMIGFLKKICGNHSNFFTGEGADEIFGGYPWFIRKELLQLDTFPWSKSTDERNFIINQDLQKILNIKNYIHAKYTDTLKEVPQIDESLHEKKLREISYLNIKWFMATLIDRTQRAAALTNLNPYMPYTQKELVEYLFNIPWSIKLKNNIPKYILRKAFEDMLPQEIVYRKKSPFPKTYNPSYEKELRLLLADIIKNKNEPIYPLLNIGNIEKMIASPSQYDMPWFGQLMAGPQQMAFIIQINYWLKHYNITIEI